MGEKYVKVNGKVDKILKIQDLSVLFLAVSLIHEAVVGKFD